MKQRGLPVVLCLVVAIFLGAWRSARKTGSLHQVSTLQALMEGAYDGQVTLAQLREHGDFGIGTFHGLNGEMIVLDGTVYQVTVDGKVHMPPASTTTPYATVTNFTPSISIPIRDAGDLAALEKQLDAALPTTNLFYAVRINGLFKNVKVRSVPAQSEPYPRLADAVKQQKVYDLGEMEGTLVGIRCPGYASGVNMPGWHLHFLSKDRTKGGHVLALETYRQLRPMTDPKAYSSPEEAYLARQQWSSMVAKVAVLNEFEMDLPRNGKFFQARMDRDYHTELKGVERQ